MSWKNRGLRFPVSTFFGKDASLVTTPLYSVSSRVVHNDALGEFAFQALRVTTSEAQWSNAVEFPPQHDVAELPVGLALNLRVLVHDGEIGLGLLTADGSGYRHESRVGAGAEPELVDIPLPKGAAPGSLVVRNTSASGRSRADIEIIGSESAPEADQPYWIALRTVADGALCRRVGDMLCVTTPAAQWSNAIELPPQQGAVLPLALALNLRVLVHEGEIGLGLLTPAGEYRQEVQIGAGTEAELVDIVLPQGTALGSLVTRNTSANGRSWADIEIIGSEPAPGAEQPYWTALRTVHNDTMCIRADSLLRIVTPAAQWADAVEYPPATRVSVLDKDGKLKIRVRVYEGVIGIGLLDPERDKYQWKTEVVADDESELVEIPLPSAAALGPVMLRNASAKGSSKADVEILGWEMGPITAGESTEIGIDPNIFAPFKPWSGFVPSGFSADWTGVLTRIDVWAFTDDDRAIYSRDRHETKTVPIDGELILDWTPLALAVKESADTFRMAALGAGWGRWLAGGAALAVQTGQDYRLLGVEAEPQHFKWMLRHFRENDIPENHYIALNAAAVGTPGDCLFAVGDSQAWYGQSIVPEDQVLRDATHVRRTRGVTMDEILNLLSPLDYLHLDIQGAELDVLSYQPNRLDREVRLVNIGTHSAEIEGGLRRLFRRLGWECLYDVKLGSKHPVRLGACAAAEVNFGDGVQIWRNPRLRAA